MPVKKKTYLLSEVNNLIIKNNYINDIPSIFINAGNLLNSFNVPGSSTWGVTVDSSGNLISGDFDTNPGTIYIHSGISSTITTSFSSPDGSPKGITVDPNTGNLISIGDTTDKIYVHDGISSTTTNNFSTPSSNPLGLTIDPNTGNLISIDQSTNPGKIYVHSGISSTTTSFDSPGNFPRGLTIDPNGNLISGDNGTNKIYIHDGISSQITSSFDAPDSYPKGLTIDPNTGNLIVVAYDGEYKFYIVKL